VRTGGDQLAAKVTRLTHSRLRDQTDVEATSLPEVKVQAWDVVSVCIVVDALGSSIDATMRPAPLSAKAEAM
jgi:hypothetical protein